MINQRFDPVSILAKLNTIEEIFPVNDWQVNGLKVWPVIRTSLAYSQNQNVNTKKNKRTTSLRANKLAHYLKVVARLPFDYVRLKRHLSTAKRLFYGASTYRVKLDGKLINKFFDVAIGDFEQAGETSVVLDAGIKHDPRKYPHYDMLFSLPSLYILHELGKKLSVKKPSYDVSLPRYEEFFAYILDELPHAAPLRKNFTKAAVIRRITALHDRKEFLKQLLRKSSIRSAYFICYYSSQSYPIIAACNELGITTADLQHGGLGAGHYSYDRWSRCPAEGYALLPRYFWNWDTNSAALINQWAEKTSFHKAFAIGNPWTDASVRIYRAPAEYNNYWLVGMTEITLDDFVIGAIRHFGSTRQWVLRMHPRQYHHKDTLLTQLRENGIEQYVLLENPHEMPMPVTLRHCQGMISKSSGSIIEAVEMGLKPILLRSPIMNYYAHYIEEGKVTVLPEDTTEHLVEALKQMAAEGVSRKADTNIAAADKFHTFEQLSTPAHS
jgi:hypothetical protein